MAEIVLDIVLEHLGGVQHSRSRHIVFHIGETLRVNAGNGREHIESAVHNSLQVTVLDIGIQASGERELGDTVVGKSLGRNNRVLSGTGLLVILVVTLEAFHKADPLSLRRKGKTVDELSHRIVDNALHILGLGHHTAVCHLVRVVPSLLTPYREDGNAVDRNNRVFLGLDFALVDEGRDVATVRV